MNAIENFPAALERVFEAHVRTRSLCPWLGAKERLHEEVGELLGALKNYLVSRFGESRMQQQAQGLPCTLGYQDVIVSHGFRLQ